MIEAKDRYERPLFNIGERAEENVTEEFLDESERQVQAAQGRPIIWFFSEARTAAFAEQLFAEHGHGREKILIVVVSYRGTVR
jgi:hypothetical protein